MLAEPTRLHLLLAAELLNLSHEALKRGVSFRVSLSLRSRPEGACLADFIDESFSRRWGVGSRTRGTSANGLISLDRDEE